MAESSHGNRVTLAEAVTWIAYGRTKSVDAAKIRRWRRNRRPGRLRHLPKSIQDRLNDAGKKLLAWLIEGRVRAGGFPYIYDGGPKISGSYSEIEIDFLRNGVLCEPAHDMIVTDHTLVDDRSNFVHHHTWGFARVTIDERDIKKCIATTVAPAIRPKKPVGRPAGSGSDDTSSLQEMQRLMDEARSSGQAITIPTAASRVAEAIHGRSADPRRIASTQERLERKFRSSLKEQK